MPAEDAYIPGKKVDINPKNLAEKDEEAGLSAKYWEEKAKAARSKREYEEEEAKARQVLQPTAPPEPPLKIKGEVNLGTFDFQQQQRELQEQLNKIKSDYENQVMSLNEKQEHYREKVHELELKAISDSLGAQISALQKMVQETNARPGQSSFDEQMANITKYASMLGYTKAAGDSMPPDLRLEILKLENAEAQRQREFEWQMKQDDRRWQLEFKKAEAQAATAAQQLQHEREKLQTIARFPELLGQSIAHGLLSANEPRVIEETPEKPRKRQSGGTIQAGINDSGTLPCPNCGAEIAIGPTARHAVCPNCDSSFPIQRVAEQEEE